MARPLKNPDSRLSEEVRLRLTVEQKQRIQQALNMGQVEFSEWARGILLQAAADSIERSNKPPRSGERRP
jgi:hypothetical protein